MRGSDEKYRNLNQMRKFCNNFKSAGSPSAFKNGVKLIVLESSSYSLQHKQDMLQRLHKTEIRGLFWSKGIDSIVEISDFIGLQNAQNPGFSVAQDHVTYCKVSSNLVLPFRYAEKEKEWYKKTKTLTTKIMKHKNSLFYLCTFVYL